MALSVKAHYTIILHQKKKECGWGTTKRQDRIEGRKRTRVGGEEKIKSKREEKIEFHGSEKKPGEGSKKPHDVGVGR